MANSGKIKIKEIKTDVEVVETEPVVEAEIEVGEVKKVITVIETVTETEGLTTYQQRDVAMNGDIPKAGEATTENMVGENNIQEILMDLVMVMDLMVHQGAVLVMVQGIGTIVSTG
eukprot:813879_1